jgi:hypothetical protein
MSSESIGCSQQKNVNFNEENFKVLAQPQMFDYELYWELIKELLTFSSTIASQRKFLSGQSLIDLFNIVNPEMVKILDLDNP